MLLPAIPYFNEMGSWKKGSCGGLNVKIKKHISRPMIPRRPIKEYMGFTKQSV